MLVYWVGVVLSLCNVMTYAASTPSTLKTDLLAAKALNNLWHYALIHSSPSTGCKCPSRVVCTTCSKLSFRLTIYRSDMSKTSRRAYISAVQRLAKKPSRIPKSLCPGCLSRYDDFVATHMNQTFTIHATVSLIHTS